MALAPFLSVHPGQWGVVSITEPTYTSIGTRVPPRAQGRKKCPVRSPSQYVGERPEPICDIISAGPGANRGEQGLPPLLSRVTVTAELGLCPSISSSMKMTQMLKALLTFGDLSRQVQLHRRPPGRLRH